MVPSYGGSFLRNRCALGARRLTKRYRGVAAVDAVDLSWLVAPPMSYLGAGVSASTPVVANAQRAGSATAVSRGSPSCVSGRAVCVAFGRTVFGWYGIAVKAPVCARAAWSSPSSPPSTRSRDPYRTPLRSRSPVSLTAPFVFLHRVGRRHREGTRLSAHTTHGRPSTRRS
jgi:hypothetical protein